MGAPNSEYIPAAVLYLHPGSTASELVDALDRVHYSDLHSCSAEREWDDPGEDETEDVHRGMIGLAQILGLERRNVRTEMEKLFHAHTSLFVYGRREGTSWKAPTYCVCQHTENALGPRQTMEGFISHEEPKEGELCTHWWNGFYVIDAIHSKSEQQPRSELFDDDEPALFTTNVTARSVTPMERREEFDSLDDLLKTYPCYKPEEMYDFSQTEGVFRCLRSTSIHWIQTEGRYSLDTNRLWNEDAEHVFTSILLTAEAIRRKAWNFLGYNGARHVERFFADVPDVKRTHDRAVMYWWAAKHAQSHGMTNTEFLRMAQEMHMGEVQADPAWEARQRALAVEAEGSCTYLRTRELSEAQRTKLADFILQGKGATAWIRTQPPPTTPRRPRKDLASPPAEPIPF